MSKNSARGEVARTRKLKRDDFPRFARGWKDELKLSHKPRASLEAYWKVECPECS